MAVHILTVRKLTVRDGIVRYDGLHGRVGTSTSWHGTISPFVLQHIYVRRVLRSTWDLPASEVLVTPLPFFLNFVFGEGGSIELLMGHVLQGHKRKAG